MSHHRFKIGSFVLIAGLLGSGSSYASVEQPQRAFLINLNTKGVTELEALPGYPEVFARALNDAGQVTGYAMGGRYESRDDSHAFITGSNGIGITDIGRFDSRYNSTFAYDINASGQVAGSSAAHGIRRAFVTGPDGAGMRDLGTLGGDHGRARGINDAGQVAGESQVVPRQGVSHAFMTGPNGSGMRDLGVLASGDDSRALAINASGQVAGYSSIYEGSPRDHIFVTGPDGANMVDLGIRPSAFNNEPLAINDAGQVVGSQLVPFSSSPQGNSYVSHAFITQPDGSGVIDLGTLGGDESYGVGVNDAGQVVGKSAIVDGGDRAFVTGIDGSGMTDLNSLIDLPDGVILTEAIDINNIGQVIAVTRYIPPVPPIIPEPETYALLLAGLGLIGFKGRPRKLKA